ncbi:ABC transporter substrate-binding protein, partial [bacterium]|nr:ABC transporter substrate-binding protein [bacterium]
KRGIELALGKENQLQRDSLLVNLITEDSQSDPKLALSAYQSIKQKTSFPVAITWGSGVGIALTPIVNQDKVVQIGVATASPLYSTPDDYTFRNFPASTCGSLALSKFFSEKFAGKSFYIVHNENDYGVGAAKAAHMALENVGLVIAGVESFLPTETDFRAILTRIRAKKPAVIYLASYTQPAALFIKQARELGITSQFIASEAILDGEDTWTTGGKAVEGIIVSSSSPYFEDRSNAELVKFIDQFKASYKREPNPIDYLSVRAYDSVKIILPIIDRCKSNTECIKQELFKVQNFHAASGLISFDVNGDIPCYFTFQRFYNGKFELVG